MQFRPWMNMYVYCINNFFANITNYSLCLPRKDFEESWSKVSHLLLSLLLLLQVMKYFYFTNVKYFLTTKIYTWIHLLEISSSLGYRIATNSSHLPGFNCIIMCVCLFYVLITKNKPTIYKSELINERLTNSPFVDPFARNSFCLSLTLAMPTRACKLHHTSAGLRIELS
jgi:hypothetical protein